MKAAELDDPSHAGSVLLMLKLVLMQGKVCVEYSVPEQRSWGYLNATTLMLLMLRLVLVQGKVRVNAPTPNCPPQHLSLSDGHMKVPISLGQFCIVGMVQLFPHPLAHKCQVKQIPGSNYWSFFVYV